MHCPRCCEGLANANVSLRRRALNFQDDREDQGTLAGVLVDVALQVDADLFFQDAPVDLFFGIGLFDCFEDDFAGAGHELGAVVAEHAAGDDLGRQVHAAGVFVDGDDGDDDAVFGEVPAVADDNFFNFFERAGIDARTTGGDWVAAVGAVFGEFDDWPSSMKQDFAGDDTPIGARARRA